MAKNKNNEEHEHCKDCGCKLPENNIEDIDDLEQKTRDFIGEMNIEFKELINGEEQYRAILRQSMLDILKNCPDPIVAMQVVLEAFHQALGEINDHLKLIEENEDDLEAPF